MVGMMKQNFSDVKFLPPGTRHGLKSLKWTQNGQILTDSKNVFVSNLGFPIRINPIHGGNDETKIFWCQIFTPGHTTRTENAKMDPKRSNINRFEKFFRLKFRFPGIGWILIRKPKFETKKFFESVNIWPFWVHFRDFGLRRVPGGKNLTSEKFCFVIPTMYGVDYYQET